MVVALITLCVSCSSGGDTSAVVPLTAVPTSSAGAPVSTTTAAGSIVTTTDTVITTTKPWSDEQLEVIAAFEAAELAFREARADPINPDWASLRNTRTAAAMTRAIALLEERVALGQATRFPSGIATVPFYVSVVVDDDLAFLEACEIDDAVLFALDTGEAIDDDVVTFHWEAQMRAVAKQWKFDALEVLESDEGGVECP